MPLIVGIENGTEKGFTEEELDFTNGYAIGILAMTAGLDAVIPRWNKNKSWDEKRFLTRMRLCNQITGCYANSKTGECKLPEWFDLDFVKRMNNAEWSCNVGHISAKEFNTKMKNILFDRYKGKLCQKYEDYQYNRDVKV